MASFYRFPLIFYECCTNFIFRVCGWWGLPDKTACLPPGDLTNVASDLHWVLNFYSTFLSGMKHSQTCCCKKMLFVQGWWTNSDHILTKSTFLAGIKWQIRVDYLSYRSIDECITFPLLAQRMHVVVKNIKSRGGKKKSWQPEQHWLPHFNPMPSCPSVYPLSINLTKTTAW